jgi:hypothetical protein
MLRIRLVRYPEGDQREIDHALSVNQMVDLNGVPIRLPLATPKTIVYRVWKVTTAEERRMEEVTYHLELVTRPELEAYAAGGRRECS